MSRTKWACRIPAVPGPDLLHPSVESAEREAANARRQGHEASVEPVEVLLRPTLTWTSVTA